jgi:hypothetical protein
MGDTVSSKKHQRDPGYVEAGLGAKKARRQRRNLHAKRENVPVPGDIISASNQEESSPRQGEETQAPDMKPQSSDTVTRGIRRHKRAVAHRLMDFPTPDYSKIKPKVSCWISKPKFGGKDKKVLVPNYILPTESQQESSSVRAKISGGQVYDGSSDQAAVVA